MAPTDSLGDAYHAATMSAVAPAQRKVKTQWTQLLLSGMSDEVIGHFFNASIPVIGAMQSLVANLTSTFLARRVGGKPAGVNPEIVNGRDGISIHDVYERPVLEAQTLMLSRPPRQVLEDTMPRIDAMLKTDAQLAKVRQARESLRFAGVEKFKRVPHPEMAKSGKSCPLCLLASTKVYNTADLMDIHPRCNCDVDVIRRGDLVRVGGKLYVGLRTLEIPDEYTHIGPRGGNADTAYYLEMMQKRNWTVLDDAYENVIENGYSKELGPTIAARATTKRTKPKAPPLTWEEIDAQKRIAAAKSNAEPFYETLVAFKRKHPDIPLPGMTPKIVSRILDSPDSAEIVEGWLRGIDDVLARYPLIEKGIVSAGFGDTLIAFATTEPVYFDPTKHSVLNLSKGAVQAPSLYKKDMVAAEKEHHFWPGSAADPGYTTAVHEMAHVLDNYTERNVREDINYLVRSEFWKEHPEFAPRKKTPAERRRAQANPLAPPTRDPYREALQQNAWQQFLRDKMSGYSVLEAEAGGIGNVAAGDLYLNQPEALAEAFEDTWVNGENASSVSWRIRDELDKAYKEYADNAA